jgi:hypothetical protein
MKAFIRKSYLIRIFGLIRECINWSQSKYAAPSPQFIKRACLIRNCFPDGTWVETGTYLGQTTKILSSHGSMVYSIEPEPTLFANAKLYFKSFNNVAILCGTSEQVFPSLLPTIHGDVNFWLDGHYSSGITFHGAQDTPILDELKHITANLNHFGRICVLIDDIRCFNPRQPEFAAYPPLDVLVDWAREYKLHWHIEQDIFVAKN